MKRRLSTIAVFAALAFGLAMPANATVAGVAHTELPRTVPGTTVVPVHAHDWYDRPQMRGAQPAFRGDRRHWRGDRRHWRGDHRRWDRRHYRPRSGIYFHITPPAPRYVEPRRVHRASQAHYRWCQARYRSYRAWDNTFQPYNGPRRQCISPYG